MLLPLLHPSSPQKPYKAPELDIISMNAEKTVLSEGFTTEDWGKDPEEIG